MTDHLGARPFHSFVNNHGFFSPGLFFPLDVGFFSAVFLCRLVGVFLKFRIR